jgi:hypothetical protein
MCINVSQLNEGGTGVIAPSIPQNANGVVTAVVSCDVQ